MIIERVGFIGLGSMGLPMAENLCKAGYLLRVAKHRSAAPVEKLKQMGAEVRNSFADVAKDSQVILSILPADREIEEVLLNGELLEQIQPGTVLVEMTSGSPEMMKRVASEYKARGAEVLDAPVSGGTGGAQKGTLTAMVGGEDRTLEKVYAVIETMAKNIIEVGDVGAGKGIKAINQMLAATHAVAASEAIAIAEKLNVDMDILQQVIKTSSGYSWIFDKKFESIVNRDFRLGFRLKLMMKDVGIALNEGSNIPLPLTSGVFQLYQLASKKYGDEDISSISQLMRGGSPEQYNLEKS